MSKNTEITEEKPKIKYRRTYKNKTPLTRNQAEVARIDFQKQENQIQQDALKQISDQFSEKLPILIEERKKEFEKALELFKLENEVEIISKNGKVRNEKLTNILCKPVLGIFGYKTKLSANDLYLYSQCYWDCIYKVNETMLCVPTIQNLCKLMGISTTTLVSYKNSKDETLKEVIQMIYDEFVSFYTVKGLTRELSEIMAMFTMKSQFGIRDNDTPQIVVNNINKTLSDEDIARLEQQYGFNNNNVIDVFDEV